MAENITCTIVIKADESATDPNEPRAASGEGGEQISVGKKKQSSNLKKTVAVAAYGYAKRAAMTVWDYNVSTIALRSGQERLQERQELAKKYITFGASLVESAVGGFLLSGGNPIGAAVGIAMTTTFKVAELAIEQSKFNMQRTVDDIGLTQANIRAGAGSDRIGKNSI